MATFYQGDWAYDWLLEFMNEQGAWQNCEEVIVTAKSVGKKWGMNLGGNDRDVKLGAYYQPASSNKHLWCWNGTWIEVQRMQGSRDYRTGKEEGACINLKYVPLPVFARLVLMIHFLAFSRGEKKFLMN